MLAAALAAPAVLGCKSQVEFHVRPDDALNENRPCYLVVRNVDSKTYLEETYQAAPLQVTAPDDSVLETAVVFPGTKKEISVSPPAKGMVALYVFFYHPTGDWRRSSPPPRRRTTSCWRSRLRVERGEPGAEASG